jgi:hypothetical protein
MVKKIMIAARIKIKVRRNLFVQKEKTLLQINLELKMAMTQMDLSQK